MKSLDYWKSKILRHPVGLAWFLFAFIALLIYLPSLSYDFFLVDDGLHITLNAQFHPLTFGRLLWIWGNSMIPVSYTVWAGLVALFGTHIPFPFRALNIFLHITNTILVFQCLRILLPVIDQRLKDKTLLFAAALGSTFFLLHPAQVETVVWISSLRDLLAFFFALIALITYLKIRTRPDGGSILLPQSLVLLAALAKLSGGTALILMAAFDAFLFKRDRRQIWWEYGLIGTLGAVFIYLHQSTLVSYLNSGMPGARWRFPIAADTLVYNLKILFFPFDCHFDYGRSALSTIAFYEDHLEICLTTMVLALLVLGFGLFCYRRQRLKFVAYSLLITLITMLPSLGFIPFVHENISTVADHYLYFPIFGVAVGFSCLVLELKQRPVWVAVLLSALLVFAATSASLVNLWADPIELMKFSIAKTPGSYYAHVILSQAYRVSGFEVEALREENTAKELYWQLRKIKPQ